jgi:GDP-mannose 6-dehydrogenase
MNIAVFGLGYVGAVSVAALAEIGHNVIGVDPNESKVEMVRDGKSPIVETGVAELMAAGQANGRIRATSDAAEAVAASDVSIICVGTPSRANGSLELGQIENVCEEIGKALAKSDRDHHVIVRSTMLPGSMADVVLPTLEKSSGRVADVDFGVCYNPEFLREGSSVNDFWNPPFTVVGCRDQRTVDVVREIYAPVTGEFVETGIGEAEMIKYVSNVFHALKVTFANEIGTICKAVGIDSHVVMDIFKRDRKLNISEAYLNPGFAFGGSCLPKDLRALTSLARMNDVHTPVVSSILPSNRAHVDRAFEMIRSAGSRRVGFFGMSFKAGTDDLRESPLVELIERSIGKGYEVLVYDENVSLADLHGSNREYIVREIPHIASLIRDDMQEIVESCDTLVIGNRDVAFEAIPTLASSQHTVIDLVRLAGGTDNPAETPRIEGIAW